MSKSPFVILCKDKAKSESIRTSNLSKHRAYLDSTPTRILLAGPLMSDDRSRSIGSLFVVEVESKEDAWAFNRADPFASLGLWDSVDVLPFTLSRHTLT
jgi:uncharacterized protein YciI